MNNRFPVKRFAAFLVLLSLLASFNAGCSSPKVSRDQLAKVAGYGQQLSGLIEANYTLPDSLAAQGVITAARAAEVKGILDAARSHVKVFNDGMTRALAEERPDLASLVPLVADIISDVERLNVGIKNQAYKKTLAAIEISLRAVASYFALQIKTAAAQVPPLKRQAFVAVLKAKEPRLYESGRLVVAYADAAE
ncbi:MAG: hypothetical protein ACJ741_06575 [Pyrinomonadaceae bacterium]